jgi:hypothetical protein
MLVTTLRNSGAGLLPRGGWAGGRACAALLSSNGPSSTMYRRVLKGVVGLSAASLCPPIRESSFRPPVCRLVDEPDLIAFRGAEVPTLRNSGAGLPPRELGRRTFAARAIVDAGATPLSLLLGGAHRVPA